MSFPGPNYLGSLGNTVAVFSDTSVDGSATIAWPAGVQLGDVAILFDHAHTISTAPTSVVPSGFTANADSAVNGTVAGRGIISRKVCTGSETGNITGMAVTSANQKRLVILRGATPITTATPSTFNSESVQGDPALQTVLSGAAVPPAVVVAMAAGSGGTTFSTATPAFDSSVTSGDGRMSTGYKIYNDSPANHSVDMGASANASCLISGYLALA